MYERHPSIGTYQEEAYDFLIDTKAGALFLPMGTGKTYVAIEVLKHHARLKNSTDFFPVLVFAPKIVCQGWVREIQKFGNGLTVHDASDGPSHRRAYEMMEALEDNVDIVVTNYEFAPKVLDQFDDLFGTLICDESTRVKNVRAKRSKAVYEIARKCEYRYIMTGSPITRDLSDIYGQCYVLDRGNKLGTSYWKFLNRFFTPLDYGPGQRGWVPKRGSLEKVRSVISPMVFSRRREECISLPGKTYIEVPVKPSQRIQQLTKEILDYWSLGEQEFFNALAVDMALRQINCGFILGDQAEEFDSNKYAVMLELIEEAGDEQVVVWTNFVKEQERVMSVLRDNGISCEAIRGSTPSDIRTQYLDDFETKKFQVIVISEQVGAYGLNQLQHASLVIYSSNSYDLELRKQSEDRTYRAGRTTKCVYYDLVTEGSIEEHILRLLKKKYQVSKQFIRSQALLSMGDMR